MAKDETATGDDGGGGISGGDLVRLAPPVVLALLVLAFGLANTRSTRIDFLVTETEAPLIVVLLATAVVGALIAALLRRRRRD